MLIASHWEAMFIMYHNYGFLGFTMCTVCLASHIIYAWEAMFVIIASLVGSNVYIALHCGKVPVGYTG